MTINLLSFAGRESKLALPWRIAGPTMVPVMTRTLGFLLITLFALLPGGSEAQSFLNNQGQCRGGQFQCGLKCCSVGQRCSYDGFCIQAGGTYCGGGRSCGPFEKCVAGGTRCAPAGANKCASRLDCPSGSFCNARGECERSSPDFDPSPQPATPCDDGRTCAAGSTCLPGGGCTRPGWYLCEETGSQCRAGFKCSANQGCVPRKAVDCGYGKWCRPGEQCLPEGGCEKLPDGD
ncbi:scavenger receptor class F, member 2 [Ruegeria arenilitoris]|uniref:scavenger receptor class F, member 2 n=2 Tax=Ruegeria arenilitoris TaxID=1173585 RepID=UPI0020C4C4A1|nr:scavenger receptor class F, member 2 [Ruegeria arenilitoris]